MLGLEIFYARTLSDTHMVVSEMNSESCLTGLSRWLTVLLLLAAGLREDIKFPTQTIIHHPEAKWYLRYLIKKYKYATQFHEGI